MTNLILDASGNVIIADDDAAVVDCESEGCDPCDVGCSVCVGDSSTPLQNVDGISDPVFMNPDCYTGCESAYYTVERSGDNLTIRIFAICDGNEFVIDIINTTVPPLGECREGDVNLPTPAGCTRQTWTVCCQAVPTESCRNEQEGCPGCGSSELAAFTLILGISKPRGSYFEYTGSASGSAVCPDAFDVLDEDLYYEIYGPPYGIIRERSGDPYELFGSATAGMTRQTTDPAGIPDECAGDPLFNESEAYYTGTLTLPFATTHPSLPFPTGSPGFPLNVEAVCGSSFSKKLSLCRINGWRLLGARPFCNSPESEPVCCDTGGCVYDDNDLTAPSMHYRRVSPSLTGLFGDPNDNNSYCKQDGLNCYHGVAMYRSGFSPGTVSWFYGNQSDYPKISVSGRIVDYSFSVSLPHLSAMYQTGEFSFATGYRAGNSQKGHFQFIGSGIRNFGFSNDSGIIGNKFPTYVPITDACVDYWNDYVQVRGWDPAYRMSYGTLNTHFSDQAQIILQKPCQPTGTGLQPLFVSLIILRNYGWRRAIPAGEGTTENYYPIFLAGSSRSQINGFTVFLPRHPNNQIEDMFVDGLVLTNDNYSGCVNSGLSSLTVDDFELTLTGGF